MPASDMRACFIFLCLLAATFGLSVKSKPHGKHEGVHKTSQGNNEKDIITQDTNKFQILPTSVTLVPEAKRQEQEYEELSSEGNANSNKEGGELKVTDKRDKTTAVLLSEEELVDLMKKEAEEEEEVEEGEFDKEEEESNKGNVEYGEAVGSNEYEEDEGEGQKIIQEDKKVTSEKEEIVEDEVEGEVEIIPQKDQKDREDNLELLEETGSTLSEIPENLDYAADSGALQAFESAKAKSDIDVTQPPSKVDLPGGEEKETVDEDLPIIADDYEQDMQKTEAADSDDVTDQENVQEDKNEKDKESQPKPKEISEDAHPQEPMINAETDSGSRVTGKEEEKSKNDSGGHTKGKTRKQKKNQRAKNHSPQPGQEQTQQEPQESGSSSTENIVHKSKRRREGKWGPLVGMNPVQIRATVDLYPSSRPSLGESTHHPETPADPCDNFHCKRGKMCKLDANNKPRCVCQEPSKCPHSVNEFDHVCGTDNITYDTSCELFATKCNLEGTKKGHRLHLDYTGPCKFIPLCVDTELVQFPLRMRDWLKNVLLQLYEHDSTSPGFLTTKQRFRVKKIFESERRLHAGDHSVELLAQDFEKNYNMYIYPVHWQFAQLDQHPSDRLLSHSELAPLRVPLVPMEHCTSRFFQECDADKDKQVSFKEWTSCFAIKNEDMDANLLF